MPRLKLREKLKKVNRESLKRHKRLLISFGVLLLFLVLVGVPVYITSLPSYYSRMKPTESYYKSWRVSTHAEVKCVRCHVAPKNRGVTAFTAKTVGSFYLRFFLGPDSRGSLQKPANVSCLECHSGTRTASPSGDLRIPHRAHVDVLKMACIECHAYVVHRKNPEGNHRPRMVSCLSCHDGKRASSKCDDCHKKKSSPVSHRADDWLVVHSQKTQEVNCRQCHGWVKKYCEDCHQNKPASHAQRWRTFHRLKVAKNRNCATCHQEPFCIRCHGEVP